MILHLLEDTIFTDYAIRRFEEAAPDINFFLINIPDENYILKHIKNTSKVITAVYGSKIYNEFLSDLVNYDVVIFHSLIPKYKHKILKSAPKDTKLHWISWGADLYSIKEFKFSLYKKNTYKYFNLNVSKKRRFLLGLEKKMFAISFLWKRRYMHTIHYKRLVRKFHSVSTIVPTEYKFIKRYFSKKIKYIDFNYIIIDEIFNENLNTNGDNIYVGNSATLTSNHLDAFEWLKRMNIFNRKIIVPLSYGLDSYSKHIKMEGLKSFGDQFLSLDRFIPLEKYNEILVSCSDAIFNHKRQQAYGVILSFLWMGARVYLDNNNPVYLFLIKNNFIIFDMDRKSLSNYSNQKLKKHNRELLLKFFSKNSTIAKTKGLVNYFEKT